MKQLDQRITALEQLIGDGDLVITDTIYNQIQQMREIARQQNLSSKLYKMASLIYNYDLNYCYSALPPQSKIQLIMQSEKYLQEASQNLIKIIKYRKFVDFEPIIGLQEKINQILLLQTASKLALKDDQIVVNQINSAMLMDDFNRYQQQLETLVLINYELNQQIE
ncbi:unnamed protein product (macronuclear) [Paramecium tetraurelia]|uniref:Uncharacterized protein n=1 Tax=Paramecium tetraurelia TaxID=5888 RepID=A0DFZ1_PARTE|nr:uncharacterized protein GSPATT00002086001 [Paramecium tetraurelia]CAK81958.1 unnamed protein product [Paramecium tetraurelia]|eukprot:XP_001449355.1 hypothetical protein (macronuclear) [Paramecium tetraurelia strain d4-2]